MPTVEKLQAFRNESMIPFGEEKHALAMRQALAEVRGRLGREYKLAIGGRSFAGSSVNRSVNPARPSEVIGVHHEADAAAVEAAVEAASKAFETWRFARLEERTELLRKVAEGIRTRRYEFCAWLVLEAGKNWGEADAEVGEAIDFLEFYALEAERLAEAAPPIQFPGERDEFRYVPLGVAVVLPPWNFPLAILAGMTMAAVVTGNTAIVKPSPDAPTVAAIFVELVEQCGAPAGVVNLCQGGVETGRILTVHPRVRFIAFTGSRRAGLEIHARAAQTQAGQLWIKRTILEMGGKDAIIVDRDADLGSALDGVVASAYGFNGQKCSACSRLIVDDAVYDGFVAQVAERAGKLATGDPAENFATGPVINRAAYDRVLDYIEIGKKEGRLVAGGRSLTGPEDGYYLAPTVFEGVDAGSRLAQEEIFGPLLAVIRARDFEHALEIANQSEYGLTGAVYTGSREKMDAARRRFEVGNLYINRKCTGAMVGAHPFGGFNMSGTDSKAGGPDYLYLFTQGKSIAERLA